VTGESNKNRPLLGWAVENLLATWRFYLKGQLPVMGKTPQSVFVELQFASQV
jgi:hypothetical protein